MTAGRQVPPPQWRMICGRSPESDEGWSAPPPAASVGGWGGWAPSLPSVVWVGWHCWGTAVRWYGNVVMWVGQVTFIRFSCEAFNVLKKRFLQLPIEMGTCPQ